MEYILNYRIHDPNDVWNILEESYRRGSSEEELLAWVKENNIEDYIISLPMYEVEKLRSAIDRANKALFSIKDRIRVLELETQYEK